MMINSSRIQEIVRDEEKFLQLLTITDKAGQSINFKMNRAQRHFHENKTGMDIILKARQLGFSTYIQADHYVKVTTNTGRTAVTLAHDADSTRMLDDKFDMFWDELPEKLRPSKGTDDKTLTKFPVINSKNAIATAGNKKAGRGSTIHHAHLSEFAFWEDPGRVLAGVLEAIPPTHIAPFRTIVIETTPNGAQGLFYDMCMEALAGRSAWKLFFYPWWWDDQYQIPLAEGEQRLRYTKEEKHLIDTHGLKNTQIKWRRMKIEEFRSRGREDEFLQEYPEDPRSCFLLSGRGRFDRKKLVWRLDTQAIDPIEEFEADMYGAPMVRIYKKPVDGYRYVIGADPSEGVDSGAAAIVRCYETNEQVATIRMKNMEIIEFSKWLRKIAVMYNYALLAIERNNHGHTVISHLLYGVPDLIDSYGHLYVHTDDKYGWNTNSTTRPLMIDHLAEDIASDDYVMLDAELIGECMNFIQTNTRAQAKKGSTDDLVMADCIAGELRRIPSGVSIAFGPPEGEVA